MSLALALFKEEGEEDAPSEQATTALQAALAIKTPFAQAY
jgi:hypothetical protein